MTRRRIDTLRREDRHCSKHGLCEFTRYERLLNGSVFYVWLCMQCNNEKSKARQAFAKDHPETVRPLGPCKPEPRPATVCPKCWTVPSVTGTCFCD